MVFDKDFTTWEEHDGGKVEEVLIIPEQNKWDELKQWIDCQSYPNKNSKEPKGRPKKKHKTAWSCYGILCILTVVIVILAAVGVLPNG